MMALRTIEGGAPPPPHSLEAERQVLGSCILRPDLLRDMELAREDFYSEGHARIWAALQYLAAEGLPIDSIHLRERLVELGQLGSAGGDDYLLDLTDTIPDVAPADIVRKLARQRGVQAAGSRLAKAAQAGDLASAQTAVREAQRALDEADRKPVAEWRSVFEVFAPLPPVPWRVRGLQICPGRPSAFVGYGASAKTLSAQALALACAAGMPAWGFFDTAPMQVRHLDYEQGWHATARRYQRLAYGMQLDQRELGDRLRVSIFPRVYLDQAGAYDAYARLCEGAELVILDSFKAATPASDENDNGIRVCVDVLTHVSETTGTAFLLLHHAGKGDPSARDQRAMGRGASSIFDGCGSWFNFLAGADKADPRTIKQAKQPAEAEGMGVQDFLLDVLDVHAPERLNAGVRVSYRAIEQPDAVAASSARFDAQSAFLVELIDRHPGLSMNELVGRSSIGRNTCLALLDALSRRGAVVESDGPRGSRVFYPRNHRGSSGGDG